jgi:phosphatidylserine/phosphatidylglycerophosphate/cardiolipin synthase-like enzyme
MDARWLDEASAADLELLAAALRDGRLRPPFAVGVMPVHGPGPAAAAFLASAGDTPPAFLASLLERLAQERRQHAVWYAQVAQLVWSGPAAGSESIRETRAVLDELFRKAERHVLIATYVVTRGREVFAALGERQRAVPGLSVEFYVNLESRTGAPEDAQKDVDGFIRTFAAQHWPAGAPLPGLYYEPDGRKQGRERGILHAKCVVVDERWAFLTSANFTDAAQRRNVEAGVLLDHPPLARALVSRFVSLRESGRFREMVLERPSPSHNKPTIPVAAPKLYRLLGANGVTVESLTRGTLGGNSHLQLYGRLDCPSAVNALPRGYARHRVFFADEAAAIANGYRPCGNCMRERYKVWKEGGVPETADYPWMSPPKGE